MVFMVDIVLAEGYERSDLDVDLNNYIYLFAFSLSPKLKGALPDFATRQGYAKMCKCQFWFKLKCIAASIPVLNWNDIKKMFDNVLWEVNV